MFRIAGQFDPKSGALLKDRLQGVVSALFAERTPSTCPTDAGLKQDHLRALALIALTLGGSVAGERPDGGQTNHRDSTADPPGEDRNGDPATQTTSRHDDDDDDD